MANPGRAVRQSGRRSVMPVPERSRRRQPQLRGSGSQGGVDALHPDLGG
jgi:hypothetical protein